MHSLSLGYCFFFFQCPDWTINGTMKNTTTPKTFRSLKMQNYLQSFKIQCSFVFAILVGASLFLSFHLVFPSTLGQEPDGEVVLTYKTFTISNHLGFKKMTNICVCGPSRV